GTARHARPDRLRGAARRTPPSQRRHDLLGLRLQRSVPQAGREHPEGQVELRTQTPGRTRVAPHPVYLTASGLIGDPTPPVTGNGAALKRKLQAPSCAQSAASPSRSNISPSVSPMSRMHSAGSGSITAG